MKNEEKRIIEYANTSRFTGGAWSVEVTGYDADDNEYRYEIDGYEGAKANWEGFKARYPNAGHPRKFFAEFRNAIRETQQVSARVR